MRLIQFNSGLRVVLKDVQQHQTDRSQQYYLLPAPPPHHSSNSSIATTSSSVKSTGSSVAHSEYYIRRPYPSTNGTLCYQHYRVTTPPIVNPTPSSSLIVEVGRSGSIMDHKINIDTP